MERERERVREGGEGEIGGRRKGRYIVIQCYYLQRGGYSIELFSLMSLMSSKKSICPRTDPCGTPYVIVYVLNIIYKMLSIGK